MTPLRDFPIDEDYSNRPSRERFRQNRERPCSQTKKLFYYHSVEGPKNRNRYECHSLERGNGRNSYEHLIYKDLPNDTSSTRHDQSSTRWGSCNPKRCGSQSQENCHSQRQSSSAGNIGYQFKQFTDGLAQFSGKTAGGGHPQLPRNFPAAELMKMSWDVCSSVDMDELTIPNDGEAPFQNFDSLNRIASKVMEHVDWKQFSNICANMSQCPQADKPQREAARNSEPEPINIVTNQFNFHFAQPRPCRRSPDSDQQLFIPKAAENNSSDYFIPRMRDAQRIRSDQLNRESARAKTTERHQGRASYEQYHEQEEQQQKYMQQEREAARRRKLCPSSVVITYHQDDSSAWRKAAKKHNPYPKQKKPTTICQQEAQLKRETAGENYQPSQFMISHQEEPTKLELHQQFLKLEAAKQRREAERSRSPPITLQREEGIKTKGDMHAQFLKLEAAKQKREEARISSPSKEPLRQDEGVKSKGELYAQFLKLKAAKGRRNAARSCSPPRTPCQQKDCFKTEGESSAQYSELHMQHEAKHEGEPSCGRSDCSEKAMPCQQDDIVPTVDKLRQQFLKLELLKEKREAERSPSPPTPCQREEGIKTMAEMHAQFLKLDAAKSNRDATRRCSKSKTVCQPCQQEEGVKSKGEMHAQFLKLEAIKRDREAARSPSPPRFLKLQELQKAKQKRSCQSPCSYPAAPCRREMKVQKRWNPCPEPKMPCQQDECVPTLEELHRQFAALENLRKSRDAANRKYQQMSCSPCNQEFPSYIDSTSASCSQEPQPQCESLPCSRAPPKLAPCYLPAFFTQ